MDLPFCTWATPPWCPLMHFLITRQKNKKKNTTTANAKVEATKTNFTLTRIHCRRPMWIGCRKIWEMISRLTLSLLEHWINLQLQPNPQFEN